MKAAPTPSSAVSTPADILTSAPSPVREIITRNRLRHTRLSERHTFVDVDVRTETDVNRPSIVTPRIVWMRRRRRKQILVAVALILGLFPPMWAVYLVAWLIWRTRKPQQSMRHVRQAVRALEKNQTGVALKQLQDAHLLDPSNNDALYWLGLLLSAQKRQDEAEEALSLVSERVPGLPEVEAALVDSYVAMDEPASAIFHAQRLFDAAPYSTESVLKLADAFESAGRIDLAIEALEQAPIHKRHLTDALLQVHFRLGDLYERHGSADRALHHFKRVYARNVSYQDIRKRVEALEAQAQSVGDDDDSAPSRS